MAADPLPAPADWEQRFTDALEDVRQRRGMGKGDFAASLGYERTAYYLLRRGGPNGRALSMPLVRKALRCYPELAETLGPGGLPPDAAHGPVPIRAAFAAYLLEQPDDAAPMGPAQLKAWWRVWQAAWHAALAEDTGVDDGR